jgi:hypothetical protein
VDIRRYVPERNTLKWNQMQLFVHFKFKVVNKADSQIPMIETNWRHEI